MNIGCCIIQNKRYAAANTDDSIAGKVYLAVAPVELAAIYNHATDGRAVAAIITLGNLVRAMVKIAQR